MGKFIDLTGKKFGKLTVIERTFNKNNSVCWLCLCDCGNYTVVRSDALRQGITKSCSCLQKEIVKKTCKNNFTKHNLCNHRLYRIYCGMKNRCNNKNEKAYINYGGRGITVCQEWQENFINFYNWAINNGYKEDLTIDRIDVNGNYEPSNCRWVNLKVQQNNRSNNRLIQYQNQIHTLAEWATITNIKYTTLKRRIDCGWSLEKAFNMQVKT